EPFLNQELIDLSAWLADKTFSFRVTCLNAMLPNLVKINTKRFVKVNRQRIDPQRVVEVLGEQQVVDLKVNELDYPQQRQLNQWVKDGSVTLEYATENSARKKMINWIWPLVDAEQITQITKTVRPNARQQLKLLQLIPEISVKEGLSQASLIKDYQISRGTVDHAVEQGWLKR
ncbi:primosomal protein N', partial [Pediococcus acidilactici]|nr:primosomal protein N' [Pediococcus acidilactici]